MTTIKTNLRTVFTDNEGNINLNGSHTQRAFGGVFALHGLVNECLYGLAGIGALIRLSNPVDKLTCDESAGVGLVIQQLSLLAIESQDYQESIESEMKKRA
jgi:hypothetical protein